MKRVLFITYDFPYPLTSGGKSRAYHLLKFAAEKNLELFLYSFVRINPTEKALEELRKIGVKKIFISKRKEVNKQKLLANSLFTGSSIFKPLYFEKKNLSEVEGICDEYKINVIQFESFYTAYYASDSFSKLGIKQIYGSENIEHLLYEELSQFSKNPLLKMAYKMQAARIKNEEIGFYKKTDATIVVTPEEGKIAKKLGAKNIYVVPNGIDVGDFKYKNSKREKMEKLLFVGNFSYFPNIQAVTYFFKEVFPRLAKNLKITIIGKNQDKVKLIPQGNKQVMSISYIDDIKEAYYDSDIFIFPVSIGGGTNFKLLEAAACGLPILALPQKVETLGFKNKVHFLACAKPEDFVENINLLNSEPHLAHTIATNARKLVEKEYSWENIGRVQNKIWQKV